MPDPENPPKESGRIKKNDWLLIGIPWIIIQIILLKIQGINQQGESVKYILAADRWINGDRNPDLYNLFYSGYISIHVILKSLGLPPGSMYIIQLIFSGLATYFFTKILTYFLHSRIAILCGAILFATCYIIQSWVSFLYTDSIFSSLLVMETYFLLTEEKSRRNKWIFWVLLVILPLFRPVGFLALPTACLYWITISPRTNKYKLLFCFGYLFLICFVVFLTFTNSRYFYYMHSYHNIRANVICGYPDDLSKFQVVPFQDGMSVFQYLFSNPGMTLRLFLARFYKVFSMGRPYFSPGHNLLLFISTTIYYVTAIIGTVVIFRSALKKLYFILAGVLLFSIPMILFCVEWTDRFSLPVICYILLLSSIGMERILFKLKSKN